MRILALGGPGAMGAAALRIAVTLPGITEIVIADRDSNAAERATHRLRPAPMPIRALEVDVTHAAALRAALTQADLVLNTVGPYYRFGLTVLRAAIETDTHYLDICDDWEPTAQMLELDQAARERGVCAIIGMGASPGISNLLAVTAAAELDRVRDVYTAWPVDIDGSGGSQPSGQLLEPTGRPSAAAVHWMHQSSGTITVVRAGRLISEPPLRPVPLLLPGGRQGTAYTVGHPEPITLHHSLKPAGAAANLMVVSPWTIAYLEELRRDIDRGALTDETAAAALARPRLTRILRAIPAALRAPGPGTLPTFFAAATGTKDGRDHAVLAYLNQSGPPGDPARALLDDMARATGIPLALGMSQVLDGTARRPGVHPPESAIDAPRLFRDLDRALGRDSRTPLILVEQEPIDQLHSPRVPGPSLPIRRRT